MDTPNRKNEGVAGKTRAMQRMADSRQKKVTLCEENTSFAQRLESLTCCARGTGKWVGERGKRTTVGLRKKSHLAGE